MIKTLRKKLINMGTRWRLSEDLMESGAYGRRDRDYEQQVQQIDYAYDILQESELTQLFKFYIEEDLTVPTRFILGKYIGPSSRQLNLPEMSMTVHATVASSYNGMLMKTVKPGKVEFVQYNVSSPTEIPKKILDYIRLLN